MRTPELVLKSPGCKAETLTLSNEHATVLLTTKLQDDDGATTEHSLLKLTVVPFHKEIFQSSDNEKDTTKILYFLSGYDFKLTSESGAEYSYYDAVPTEKKGILGSFLSKLLPKGWWKDSSESSTMGTFKVELISPASDRQIQRARPKASMKMIQETPEMYEEMTKPYIQSIVESGSLSWIENVVTVKKERERLLLEKDDYILNVDTKWRSHPDALHVPRSEWYKHECTVDLYCLAIVKDGSIASLRDLRSRHLPMLRSILTECPIAIEETYGVERDQLRIFVHYQPQFYHFHVHFTRLENEVGCQVERGHLLSDIVQNLELADDYYRKRTITFKLPVTDKLYIQIMEYRQQDTST